MNREKFLTELARLLEDIPETERQEALEYYDSYFEDAGPENESKVIQELGGTPDRVAASIRAEFKSGKTGGRQNYGEYTEQGYRDTRIPHPRQMPQFVKEKKEQKQDYKKIGLIVLVLILTSSIWLGLFGGVISLIFSLLGGILSLTFGVIAAVFSLLVSGIAMTAAGIAKCLVNPALGLLLAGLGMLLLSIGILLSIFFLWLAKKFIPWASQWSYKYLRKFCDWCKAKWKIFR